MEQSPPRRKNRVLDGPRAVRLNASIPSNLYDAVKEEAEREGHHNMSLVVATALTEYFNRKYDPRAA